MRGDETTCVFKGIPYSKRLPIQEIWRWTKGTIVNLRFLSGVDSLPYKGLNTWVWGSLPDIGDVKFTGNHSFLSELLLQSPKGWHLAGFTVRPERIEKFSRASMRQGGVVWGDDKNSKTSSVKRDILLWILANSQSLHLLGLGTGVPTERRVPGLGWTVWEARDTPV